MKVVKTTDSDGYADLPVTCPKETCVSPVRRTFDEGSEVVVFR